MKCSSVKIARNETKINLFTLISRILLYYTGLTMTKKFHSVHWSYKIAIVCFIIICALQMVALFLAKGDSDRVFECFSILAFTGMGILKMNSLINHSDNWKYILYEMTKLEDAQLNGHYSSDIDYQSDDEESYNFSNYVNEYTNKFKAASSILRYIYTFTAVIFILSPFIEYLYRRLLGIEYVIYPHIIPGWAPLDEYSIFGYILTVSCEFVAAVYCVSVHIAFDLIAIAVMIFVCVQFSLLQHYSERIGGKGRVCNLSKKRDNRARYRIKNSHRTNIILINLITELDKLLKNIIGVYFFLATLTLCAIAVQLKSKDMSVMQFLSLLQYMCGTLTQLFLFCLYGDAVLNGSSIGMGQGPFGATYWCLSPRVRRDLVLLGITMMKPLRLRAGPFNNLNLPSFIQIIRTAYSYYAVIVHK